MTEVPETTLREFHNKKTRVLAQENFEKLQIFFAFQLGGAMEKGKEEDRSGLSLVAKWREEGKKIPLELPKSAYKYGAVPSTPDTRAVGLAMRGGIDPVYFMEQVDAFEGGEEVNEDLFLEKLRAKSFDWSIVRIQSQI